MNIVKTHLKIPKYRCLHYQLLKRCFSTKDGEDPNKTHNATNSKKGEDNTKDILHKKQKIKIASTTESKEETSKRILSLISELKVEGTSNKKSTLNLSKPLPKETRIERRKAAMKKRTPEEDLALAVKAVATNLDGDPKKTEKELNEKLSSLNAKATSLTPASNKDTINIDEETNKNLMSSVEDIASTVVKTPSSTKSRLTDRLLRFSVESKTSTVPKSTIDMLVKQMKTEDRTTPKARLTSMPPSQRQEAKFSFYNSPPLGIFSEKTAESSEKTFWCELQEKQLQLLTQYAPENGFEEMIMWTKQGKHWKFPIDNETEMGDEENVGFHEHVFLEKHLEGFPTKGPIRHFMELVCVGLSKNPYITVDRKIENIKWFKDYFNQKDKKEIIQAYGIQA